MATLKIRDLARDFLLGLTALGMPACQALNDEASNGASDETFTVVAYNLENFFDLDGQALFDDYQQDYPEDPFGYSKDKLLTKLTNAVLALREIDAGRGPDIILFQEFENDFSPADTDFDFSLFLREHDGLTVAEMLGSEWKPAYGDISATAWMLKAMADAGMTGYEVAVAPTKSPESRIAHVNAVFSRFPIEAAQAYPTAQARDIQEVAVRVGGAKLWLYNNHWKSGASNPEREPIRVENAKVLRGLIDRRLEADPQADIVVGGDLNSHYNHGILFSEIQTGINDVLGSSGVETFDDNDLYNLWFELPPEARYSEVWRGNRGSLMHLLVSPGLYDETGVSYVDSSFQKLLLPGLNADALGRPLSWHFAGRSGGGTSDHFPVLARFSPEPFEKDAPYSKGDDAPDYEIPLGYTDDLELDLPDGAFLSALSVDELAPQVDRLFDIRAEVLTVNPAAVRFEGEAWPVYIPDRELYQAFRGQGVGAELSMVARPGFWKGKRQFVVEGIRGE